MIYFGCLPLLLIIFFLVVVALISTALRWTKFGLFTIKEAAKWLWESFLNFFRREKKEVINPFTGENNFDNASQSRDIRYSPTETRPKRYDDSDGEEVDFTDIH